jgi:16S rRNA (guanine527-N7)-methyltransferase
MIDTKALCALAEQNGISLSATQLEKLDTYARLLVEWNEKMNLTAITDPNGVAVKHFLDSLLLMPHLPKTPFSLIDVGTGAGFPGVVLGIVREDMELTLLDSLNKRLVFLEALCADLGVAARRIHARAEEGGKNPALREKFDVARARAVAAMPTLCEYCLPFVRQGGVFLAMKGPEGANELAAAKEAIRRLGGKSGTAHGYELPGYADVPPSQRCVLAVEKIAPTPAQFPRISAKIAKQPL